MNIVYDYPPNYIAITKAFNIKGKTGIVFTYGDTLYVPGGPDVEIDKHLMRHEETHTRQQEPIGADVWWQEYLKDEVFRFEQELEAYRNQYRSMGQLSLEQRLRYLDHIASDLSGAMYGNLLTKQEAVAAITDGIILKQSSAASRKAKKRARQNRKKGRK